MDHAVAVARSRPSPGPRGVPCAGPVLATITVVGAEHCIGGSAVLLTAAFAVGVAVPLLLFALVGRYLATRMRAVRGYTDSLSTHLKGNLPGQDVTFGRFSR